MGSLLSFGFRAGLQSFVMFVLLHGFSSAESGAMMIRFVRDGLALAGFLLMQATVG